MKLSKKDVEHIAKLARLDLSEEEKSKYSSQLTKILDYIDQLQEVDVTGIEPTAQVTGLENVMREDTVEEWPKDEVESALAQAPSKEGKFIKVKRVL